VWFSGSEGKTAAGTLSRGGSAVLQAKNWMLTVVGDNCQAAFGVVPGSLPVFDGKDYDDWIVKMEAILGFQELEEAVKIGFQDSIKLET